MATWADISQHIQTSASYVASKVDQGSALFWAEGSLGWYYLFTGVHNPGFGAEDYLTTEYAFGPVDQVDVVAAGSTSGETGLAALVILDGTEVRLTEARCLETLTTQRFDIMISGLLGRVVGYHAGTERPPLDGMWLAERPQMIQQAGGSPPPPPPPPTVDPPPPQGGAIPHQAPPPPPPPPPPSPPPASSDRWHVPNLDASRELFPAILQITTQRMSSEELEPMIFRWCELSSSPATPETMMRDHQPDDFAQVIRRPWYWLAANVRAAHDARDWTHVATCGFWAAQWRLNLQPKLGPYERQFWLIGSIPEEVTAELIRLVNSAMDQVPHDTIVLGDASDGFTAAQLRANYETMMTAPPPR